MDPEDYCRSRAAAHGSTLHYSLLSIPKLQRQAIHALCAFRAETTEVVWECADTGVARSKLDWWRDELRRVFAGTPQHPVGSALQHAVSSYGLAQESLQEIIDGIEMDLDQFSYPDFRTLSLYCHRVGGVLGPLSAQVLGYEHRSVLKYAHELGMAIELTHLLRDLREHAARGRIYVPADEQRQFGVAAGDLHLGVTSERVRGLLKLQVQRIRGYYQQALNYLPEQDRYAQRSGLIIAEIYMRLLDEIEQDDYRILEHRVSLTPMRKLWIAWTVERRERRRKAA